MSTYNICLYVCIAFLWANTFHSIEHSTVLLENKYCPGQTARCAGYSVSFQCLNLIDIAQSKLAELGFCFFLSKTEYLP